MLGATQAMADVDFDGFVFVQKDIDIQRDIDIDKIVDIDVNVVVDVNKAAEADTLINQTNFDNYACENCAEKLDWIGNSIIGNTGVVSVNQAAGNMNNQGNAVTIAIDQSLPIPPDDPVPDPVDPGGFADAEANVDQRNFDNFVDSGNIVFRTAILTNAVNLNVGVTHVNQATGNANNQANALTAALALADGGVALSETALGQLNTDNVVAEADVLKTAEIVLSVNNNAGVVGVNQTSGNLGNQANVITLGAAVAIQ